MSNKTTYQRRKALKICTVCGKSKALENRTRCADCTRMEKNNRLGQARKPNRCIVCGKVCEPLIRLCSEHHYALTLAVSEEDENEVRTGNESGVAE